MRDTLSLDFLTASTVRILHLKHWALDSRFLIENLPFSPAAPPGVRMRSSRLWRVSSFNFLSLHRLGVTPQILRSSFLTAVLHPAQRHREPFHSGWRIFYILQLPTLRTSETRHSTFFCLAARRHSLLRPILNSGTFFHAPLRS